VSILEYISLQITEGSGDRLFVPIANKGPGSGNDDDDDDDEMYMYR